ncbi:MAG: septum formation initiator family protein [Thermodesulfovibrionales bacterium]|nr:septum formation initiator family protein [Thermodesulfovibrionales bacterium]
MRSRTQKGNLRQQVTTERRKRNIIFFTIITLALLYISANLLLSETGIFKYLHLKKTNSGLKSEVKNMEKENKMLNAYINALKEDPFYIEKHAREEYGLARPDEYIFQFQNYNKN